MGWEAIVIPFIVQLGTYLLKQLTEKMTEKTVPDWSVPIAAAGMGTGIGAASDSVEWYIGTLGGMAAVWLTEMYRRIKRAVTRRGSGVDEKTAVRNIVVSVMVLLSMGCAAGQQIIQNGPVCYSYGEETIRFLRPTHQAPPRECPCSHLTKVKLVEPEINWMGEITKTDFYACPLAVAEHDQDTRVTPMELTASPAATFLPPAMHGLAFLGGTLGGAAILADGLRNQNVSKMPPAASPINANISTFRVGP